MISGFPSGRYCFVCDKASDLSRVLSNMAVIHGTRDATACLFHSGRLLEHHVIFPLISATVGRRMPLAANDQNLNQKSELKPEQYLKDP